MALFKALLLSVWYDLSDVKLAEALYDRASFRRFCGFAMSEPTPERTAFVRFRKELVARDLYAQLFDAVLAQLEAKGLVVKMETLIDATVLPSASKGDDEARWVDHRRKKQIHGYKAHVASDAETDIVRAVAVTTANVHDLKKAEEVLPEDPGDVYADTAHAAHRFEKAIMAHGGIPRIVQRGIWSKAPQGAGPMERPDPEGAMQDREDLRELEALLQSAVRPLLGPCPGGLPSPADGNCLQSDAGKSSTPDTGCMSLLGVCLDLMIKKKMTCRTGPQTDGAHRNLCQDPENSPKIKTRAQVS